MQTDLISLLAWPVSKSRLLIAALRILSWLLLVLVAWQSQTYAELPTTQSAMAKTVPSPSVSIETGMLRGLVEGDINVFRGIPYAAPPVGALRWKPPQPATKWEGVLNVEKFGFDCMQPAPQLLPAPTVHIPPPQVGISEDCLTLNIWTSHETATKKRPVMVWFHGGGFHMGAGSWGLYDGAQFARDGVVLVSVNYRLGVFGFFAHPALSAESPESPSNFGVLDAIAALEWVKRNIGAFGGDSGNVTIFGESAGGVLVDLLMTSPRSTGLFQRAIAQSGPVLPFKNLHAAKSGGEQSAEEWGLDFAKRAGVAPDDLAALRALPADRLLALGSGFGANAGLVIDGTVLTMDTYEAFGSGRQHKVPFLIGSNDYEGGLLSGLVKMPNLSPVEQKQFVETYNPTGSLDQKLLEQLSAGDSFMVAPARRLARKMASVGVPTFVYEFAYVPDSVKTLSPGAWHGAELSYLFGTLQERSPEHGAPTSLDVDISKRMRSYWIEFAKTGNPAGAGGPVWPAWKAGREETLIFSDRGPTVAKDHLNQRLDFQDALWSASY